jgi:glutaredoxin
MKWFFRIFFKTVRIILGPIMLIWEKVTTPKGVVRPPLEQQQIDEATKSLVLYQFKTCPFCIKVRRTVNGLSLKIETRDAQNDTQSRRELENGGGQVKVPCLKITAADGEATWMYESTAIIQYLQEQFV